MQIVKLNEHYNVKGGNLVYYTAEYPFDERIFWRRPAVIVCPGGGYEYVSAREGAPVAYQFLARGFHVFVLKYLSAHEGARYPEQLLELACAVDWVKTHAEENYVNPDEIFVVGFSAGGHLAANLAVEHPAVSEMYGAKLNCCPTAVGLGYAVITSNCAYKASHETLLRGYSAEEKARLLQKLNLENAVDENTVPAYVWTMATDALVPPSNSQVFAAALKRHGVDCVLRIFPGGQHGGSTCDLEINGGDLSQKPNAVWLDECAAFFRKYVVEKF